MTPTTKALIAAGIGALLACREAATVAPSTPAVSPTPIAVRRIPIPKVEHGYQHFESMVLETSDEFDALLDDVAAEEHWNKKADFVTAMKQANVNFQTEAVVLARYTLGSGTFKVSMLQTEVEGDEITIRLVRDNPGLVTRDMAFHCFAVILPKASWKRIRIVTSDNEESLEFKLTQ